MRITGLEPARHRHQNLNLARLPIPPYPLMNKWKNGNSTSRASVTSSTERAGIRTPDNLIKSQVLYQLSYTPLSNFILFIPIRIYNREKCPEPESNQRHEDFQSSALPTGLSGHTQSFLMEFYALRIGIKKLRGQDLNLRPSGYEPDELPDCSTPRHHI